MYHWDSHLSDEQILLDLDGELSGRHASHAREHFLACWRCRTRRQELEGAVAEFVQEYRREQEDRSPPVAGARALLMAELAQLAATTSRAEGGPNIQRWLVWVAAAAAVLTVAFFWVGSETRRHVAPSKAAVVAVPDPRLTPGAAVLLNTRTVCSQTSTKNRAVPIALQRKVFEEYGMAGVEPQYYEVDYLVTPALGGADDIHNLWPQSRSSTVWNARVKDVLEDRLRELVCDGTLDLSEAQRDISTNWIAAYRKYFHTDKPLPDDSEPSSQ